LGLTLASMINSSLTGEIVHPKYAHLNFTTGGADPAPARLGQCKNYSDCANCATAFANWVAEQAMPVRCSGFPIELIAITTVDPPICARIGAPENPKFTRHL
jgi:hypothetical protein